MKNKMQKIQIQNEIQWQRSSYMATELYCITGGSAPIIFQACK